MFIRVYLDALITDQNRISIGYRPGGRIKISILLHTNKEHGGIITLIGKSLEVDGVRNF